MLESGESRVRTDTVVVFSYLVNHPALQSNPETSALVHHAAETIAALASRGARGHLLMIADPIEETFPFAGRAELVDPEDGRRFLSGRVQELRKTYEGKLAAHRQAVRDIAGRFGWSLSLHRTDKPASQAVLSLHPLLRQGIWP